MKARILTFLSLTLLSSQLLADDSQINPDTARAYQGYLLTFIWPENQSTEQVKYKEIVSTENLIRFVKPESGTSYLDGAESSTPTEDKAETTPTPFDKFKKQLDGHVKVLSNQQWTLIFKDSGDTIKKTFHSEQEKDGHPELIGEIAIKLGRYLESDIRYQHYLFDRATQSEIAEVETIEPPSGVTNAFFSTPIIEPELIEPQPELKEFKPSLILTLEQDNKTASKKLNYLDHPTIGTLLYFEPIDLEEAMEKIALQSMTPETGASLNYDDLKSTNELSSRE
ncbi:hypothetical protein MUS1_05960 [Marinomonas ushuaiensis DSM 15871]|uniref:Peptidoglycan-binding protein CsiV n=1 Tax=Marinomonas ushuaiensis DSM 15871 TaxID=1122207 RepID=X7E0Y3_9GAMM|nr:hypothetical protein [Marinomonas ushuaiensis]ETX09739.1 hypothetical protein MUS1_05960 [Marinomonas ushuaiensis DSM 15871]